MYLKLQGQEQHGNVTITGGVAIWKHVATLPWKAKWQYLFNFRATTLNHVLVYDFDLWNMNKWYPHIKRTCLNP